MNRDLTNQNTPERRPSRGMTGDADDRNLPEKKIEREDYNSVICPFVSIDTETILSMAPNLVNPFKTLF